MSIRRDPIYISYDVWRALWLLSKSGKFDKGETVGDASSPDKLADDFLREMIKARFPQLFEHQKELEKLERKLIESLTK